MARTRVGFPVPHSSWWRRVLVGGALLSLQAGCERRPEPVPPASVPETAVRDSAGVRVVRAGFASDALGPLLTVLDTVLDGANAEQDGVIGLVAVQPLSDTSLVVFSASGPMLLRYDGRPMRASPIGTTGTAPGMYGSRATVLPYTRDTLVLWDADAGRVSWITSTGLHMHALVDYSLSRLGTVSGVWPDGTMIGMTAVPPGEQQPGVSRAPSALLRFTPTGALRDTLVAFRGVERVVQVGRAGGPREVAPVRAVSVPFGRSTLWSVGTASVLLLDTEGCEVERRDSTGALVLRLDLACAVETVTEADRAQFLAEILSSARSRSDSAVRRRFVEDATFPPSKATASGLLTDAWDRIWIRLPVQGLTDDWRWWVFDADGTPITTLRVGRDWRIASVQAQTLLVVATERDDAPPVVARLALPDVLHRRGN
jgi:hypothetical protein